LYCAEYPARLNIGDGTGDPDAGGAEPLPVVPQAARIIVSITAKATCNTGVATPSAGNDTASTTQLDPPSGTDFAAIRMEGADAAVDAHTNFISRTAFHVLLDSMSCESTWTGTRRGHRI